MGTSSYSLIYGQEPMFPLNLKILVLKLMSAYAEDANKVQIRLMNLLKMDEKLIAALEHMAKHQVVVKRWFDKRAMINSFRIYNLVLLWDKEKEKLSSHIKFQHLWIGPYQITKILGENTFRLNTLQGEFIPLPINGQFLKHYFEA